MTPGETRSKLLEAGLELMLSRGYSATSIDHVCSTAEVSKGSFYHFFSSKEEFGLAVLDSFYERSVTRVERGGFARIADPHGRLRAFLDHMEEIGPELWQHGCLMGSFATELAETSPAIRARVSELLDGLTEKLAAAFRGVVADPAEARELADEMLALVEGTIIVAQAHGEPDRIPKAIQRFRRNLETRIPALEATDAD